MSLEKNCLQCNKLFNASHSRVKCCSQACVKLYRAIHCPTTEQKKKNISLSLKNYYKTNKTKTQGEKHSKAVGMSTKGTTGKIPNSLLELSSRTVRKILKRLNIGCCRCGWNKGTCDLHHIEGKKIPNADSHSNLTYLCPNCHRLFHEKKINKNDILTLEMQVGTTWKDYYYG